MLKTHFRLPLIALLSIIFVFQSCEEGIDGGIVNSDDLEGTAWINTNDYRHKIEFVDTTNALINSHQFSYSIHKGGEDSIDFIYSGPLYLLCVDPNPIYFNMNNVENTITFGGLHRVCLVNINDSITIFSKNITTNKFVGDWVSQDNSDTLIFTKNNEFQRSQGWYSYLFDSDSITLKYEGPDKIELPAMTSYYDLNNGDTLNINYTTNYHGNIKKGMVSYSRLSGSVPLNRPH